MAVLRSTFSRRVIVTACACLMALSACASPTGPEAAVTVGLSARQFGRDSLGRVRINFRVSNAGTGTVYLARCGNDVTADIERRGGVTAAWATAYPWIACVSSLAVGPYALGPGQTVDGLQSAPLPAGEYRLRVPIGLSASDTPQRHAFSDVISIF